MNTLLLGSSSASRKMLLNQAEIPFIVVGHTADEEEVGQTLDLKERVCAIARYKMDHVVLPVGKQGDSIFVLTADSMGKATNGQVYGKPKNKKQAVELLASLNNQEHQTATGFCLEKKKFNNNKWETVTRIEKVVAASYTFEVPHHWIDRYLKNSWALSASSAIAIEGYGQQFLKTLTGSYTTVIGLPLFELRQALDTIGFFN